MFVINKDKVLEGILKEKFPESDDRYMNGYNGAIDDMFQNISEMNCSKYEDLIHENGILKEKYNRALEDIKNVKSEKVKELTAAYSDLWNDHRKTLGENKRLQSDISDLKMELERLSGIEIGDKVEVIDCDKAFPGYDKWLKENALILFPLFVDGEFVENGESGIVLVMQKDTMVGDMIYAFLNEDGKVRLINRDGIKLVEKSNT